MGVQPESESDLPPSTGESLTKAVSELTAVVSQLNARVKLFPTRAEVTRDGRARAFKVLLFGIVLILIAQLLTISTISACFLGTPTTNHSKLCSFMPGYDVTVADGKERLARFNLLLSQIQKNKADIQETKIRISILEDELKNQQAAS